jgi:hypothetical protein
MSILFTILLLSVLTALIIGFIKTKDTDNTSLHDDPENI